jgi:hypothetical protein
MLNDVFSGADSVSAATAPLATKSDLEGIAPVVEASRSTTNEHDRASRQVLIERIAALLELPVLPAVEVAQAVERPLFLVPGETIEANSDQRMSSIAPSCILGGVVPAMFIGTKAITHGLVSPNAACPPEWSPLVAELTTDCVLRGYTAFTRDDAFKAGRLLLAFGPVRLKDVCGKAGLGQAVIRNEADLTAALALEDPDSLSRCGIVLEQDLVDVVTYSVGTAELRGERISYWGQQNLTKDHQGREVYGGSDLFVVRGDLDTLLSRDLPPALAKAVEITARFDHAARQAYPGAILTRRNYDIIEGTDIEGRRHVGVLEQSWRIGGASGAEIAAFEVFRQEPHTESVRCSTVELYDRVTPPAGATVYYIGDDPVVGPMTKFTMRLG